MRANSGNKWKELRREKPLEEKRHSGRDYCPETIKEFVSRVRCAVQCRNPINGNEAHCTDLHSALIHTERLRRTHHGRDGERRREHYGAELEKTG